MSPSQAQSALEEGKGGSPAASSSQRPGDLHGAAGKVRGDSMALLPARSLSQQIHSQKASQLVLVAKAGDCTRKLAKVGPHFPWDTVLLCDRHSTLDSAERRNDGMGQWEAKTGSKLWECIDVSKFISVPLQDKNEAFPQKEKQERSQAR